MGTLSSLLRHLERFLSNPAGSGAQDAEANRGDVWLEEWKESQQVIARFDQIIFDLRKYGFSLVTILLGASGFLYAQTAVTQGGIIGIYLALLSLIFALFSIDRYHEIFLRAAVEATEKIESKLGINLTRNISKRSKEAKSGTWGHWVYMLFCAANYCLVVGRVIDFDDFGRSYANNRIFIRTATVLFLFSVAGIFAYHYFIRFKENPGGDSSDQK
jgi:hypothetical protein